MTRELVFVTGFFGSSTEKKARDIAAERGFSFISLDREIEKSDGRSVRRICMTMGEHEYRNMEYAALEKICESARDSAVIACGDGVLLDDMSAEIIRGHSLVILDMDTPEEELWQRALREENTYHAFMYGDHPQKKRSAFRELYSRRKAFYENFLSKL